MYSGEGSFARKQLEKHGWTDGNGLGRSQQGISQAIRVKIKHDTAGVGHDLAKEFSDHWWDHVYHKAAASLIIENGVDGVVVKKKTISQKELTETAKKTLYSNFIKGSLLSGGTETRMEQEGEDSDSSEEEGKKLVPTLLLPDDELLQKCGGRTAHKGARHGLRLSGKLARIQEQELHLATKKNCITAITTTITTTGSHPQPIQNGAKDSHPHQLESCHSESIQQRKKKKSKKRKRDDEEEREEDMTYAHCDGIQTSVGGAREKSTSLILDEELAESMLKRKKRVECRQSDRSNVCGAEEKTTPTKQSEDFATDLVLKIKKKKEEEEERAEKESKGEERKKDATDKKNEDSHAALKRNVESQVTQEEASLIQNGKRKKKKRKKKDRRQGEKKLEERETKGVNEAEENALTSETSFPGTDRIQNEEKEEKDRRKAKKKRKKDRSQDASDEPERKKKAENGYATEDFPFEQKDLSSITNEETREKEERRKEKKKRKKEKIRE